jgi:hypothetical protein
MKASMLGFISQLRKKKSFGNSFLVIKQNEVCAKVEEREFPVFLIALLFKRDQNPLIQKENLGIGKEI